MSITNDKSLLPAASRDQPLSFQQRQTREAFGFASAHLVGVGGCGMSAIAWALLMCGIRVSGSDLGFNESCRRLCDAGASVHIGHHAENLADAEVVIVSTAIRDSNPELQAARARGMRIMHRSEALGLFLAMRKSILITGTHGKTTTTAMLGIALDAADFDPWVFVGGRVPAFQGNTRVGGLEWAVAEADESDGSFEVLPANHIIVTNIESDHLDFWKTPQAMFDGYRRVVESVERGGVVLCCMDDPGANLLRESVSRPVLTYSVQRELGHFSADNVRLGAYASTFDFYANKRFVGSYELGVPGMHNVSNAVGVLGLTMELGGDLLQLRECLKGFHGVGRRFDIKGRANDIVIIDDYAHHPTELVATLAGTRAARDEMGGRLIAIFQPHRYTRTRDLMNDFAAAFDEADQLVLTDIFAAGESPIPGVTIDALATLVAKRGTTSCEVVRKREDIARLIVPNLRPGDIVLTLGAGDNTKTGDEILDALAHRNPAEGAAPCS